MGTVTHEESSVGRDPTAGAEGRVIGADRPQTGKADQTATTNAKMAFSGGTRVGV